MSEEMSYEVTLELAGATVLDVAYFGSYQGDWWALVTYRGQTGWVWGSFGSCDGCDAFQAEFGGELHRHVDTHGGWVYPTSNNFKEDCLKCQDIRARMIAFGESYLGDLRTQEEAIRDASKNLEWDGEAKVMLEFIKQAWAEFGRGE